MVRAGRLPYGYTMAENHFERQLGTRTSLRPMGNRLRRQMVISQWQFSDRQSLPDGRAGRRDLQYL